MLPEQFALIGVARSDGTAESWRERLHDMLKSFVGRAGAEFNTDHIDEDAWARLAAPAILPFRSASNTSSPATRRGGSPLATFYVFDNENAGTFRRRIKLAAGGCGCGGCGGGDGGESTYSGAAPFGSYVTPPHYSKPTRKRRGGA